VQVRIAVGFGFGDLTWSTHAAWKISTLSIDATLERLLDVEELATPSSDAPATDGPFAETKEIIGGYAIVDVSSMEDAISMAKGFFQLHADVLGPSYEGGGEIRPMFHQEECGPRQGQVGR
jgi:hypothetical protein